MVTGRTQSICYCFLVDGIGSLAYSGRRQGNGWQAAEHADRQTDRQVDTDTQRDTDKHRHGQTHLHTHYAWAHILTVMGHISIMDHFCWPFFLLI